MELFLEFVNAILTTYVKGKAETLGHYESYAIAGVCAILFFWVSRFIMEKIEHNPIADWRFSAEGTWVQHINAQGISPTLSIIEIKYMKESNEFAMTGRTFNTNDMSLHASWESTHTSFHERKVINYLYKAVIHGHGAPSKNVTGTGRVAFFFKPHRHLKFVLGDGNFHDPSTDNQDVAFRMRRARKQELNHIFQSHLEA